MAYINGNEVLFSANVNVNKGLPTETVADLDARISRNDKRITNLERGITPDPYETDGTVAYIKDIPENALPYAEITKIGGMSYRDAGGNALNETFVAAVESVGANLIPFAYAGNSTVRGVVWTTNENGTVDVNGTAEGGNSAFYLADGLSLPAGNYVLSGAPASAGWGVTVTLYYQDESGEYVYINAYGGETKAFTILKETNCVIYLQVLSDATVSNTVFKPMLNKGSIALPYAPYVKNTLVIPEAVRMLDGYGEGVNESVYNYIDYEKKQFVKRVVKANLGSLEWAMQYNEYFIAWIDGKANGLSNFIVSNGEIAPTYTGAFNDTFPNGTWGGMVTTAQIIYRMRQGEYTDAESFKSAMSGVMVCFELAEPEIIDISDVLPADNYIGVEGGGTLTFVNKYCNAVPSEVIYALKGE